MDRGQRLFGDGRYAEAVDEFASAYDKHKISAFLFNAAVAAERAPLRERAIELYERFLKVELAAPDRGEIEKTVERLKKELASNPAEATASSQKAEIKSIIFIESDPPGAPVEIYEKVDPKAGLLDPKRPETKGYRLVSKDLKSPTNLSLASGTYFVLVNGFRDYNPTGSQFTFEQGRVYVYRAGLSQGDFVGRVEIAVPVTSAQIYIDDPPPHRNAPRAVGPNSVELTPGKHDVWIEALGFERFQKQIVVEQGKTLKLEAPLKRVEYGYLLVSGNSDEVDVEVDDHDIGVYKRRGDPLRIRLPAGEHRVDVDAPGRKAYEDTIVIPRGQEIYMHARLEEAPGKGGAVVTTILAASCLAGGIVLNRYVAGSIAEGDNLHDPLLYTSYGLMAGAAAFTGLSIFLFVYDPSEDSSAKKTPAREFTGDTDLTLPEKEALGPRLLGLAPLFSLPPTESAKAPVPAGLVVTGAF